MSDRMSQCVVVCAGVCLMGTSAMAQSLDRTSEGFAFHVEDFDLEAVVAMIEQNRVTDADHLEEVINAEDSAINNVDIDGDGFVDPVVVREIADSGMIVFELLALPSSNPEEGEPKGIASITFTETGGDRHIEIVATYPDDAEGHEDMAFASVSEHPVFTEHLVEEETGFCDWAYAPYRMPYAVSNIYNFNYNTPRTVIESPKEIWWTRASWRKTSHIPTIPKVRKETTITSTDRAPRDARRVPVSINTKVRRAPQTLTYAPATSKRTKRAYSPSDALSTHRKIPGKTRVILPAPIPTPKLKANTGNRSALAPVARRTTLRNSTRLKSPQSLDARVNRRVRANARSVKRTPTRVRTVRTTQRRPTTTRRAASTPVKRRATQARRAVRTPARARAIARPRTGPQAHRKAMTTARRGDARRSAAPAASRHTAPRSAARTNARSTKRRSPAVSNQKRGAAVRKKGTRAKVTSKAPKTRRSSAATLKKR